LVLCEYAVADLTLANANVFHELGVRHAVRPWSTVLLFAGATRLPFDVAALRALPYHLSADGVPDRADADRAALVSWLREAREARANSGSATDSPLFQLLEGYPDAYRSDQVAHAKTDVFRDWIAYSQSVKKKLAAARAIAELDQATQAIDAVRSDLPKLADAETGGQGLG
jgi:hypothetical protein